MANLETMVTDAEREVMERTGGFEMENEKDRLLHEARGKIFQYNVECITGGCLGCKTFLHFS